MGKTDLEKGTRICSRCKVEKSLEKDFCRHSKDTAGRQHMCSSCQTEAARERREANPTYYQDIKLRHHYGISYEVYEQMLTRQNGVCAICHRAETATSQGSIRMLSVDHDHVTGEVRGLLCQKCNSLLGFVQDDISVLERAISYLTGAAI